MDSDKAFAGQSFLISICKMEKNKTSQTKKVTAVVEDIFISFRWWLTICQLYPVCGFV